MNSIVKIRTYSAKREKILNSKIENLNTFDEAFLEILDNPSNIIVHQNKFDHTKMIVLMKWAKNYEILAQVLYYFDPSLLYDKKISKLYSVMEKISQKTYYLQDKIFLLVNYGVKNFKYLGNNMYKIIHTFLAKGDWIDGKRQYDSIYNIFYRSRFSLVNMFFKGAIKRFPTEKEKQLISVLLKNIKKYGLDPGIKGKDYYQWKKQIGFYLNKFIQLKLKLNSNPTEKQVIQIVKDDLGFLMKKSYSNSKR